MNAFKLEQNLMMKNPMPEMKSSSVSFDANTDINLSFFDSPNTNGIKKEMIDTNYGSAESSVFQASNDESSTSFGCEETKYISFSSTTSTSSPNISISSPVSPFVTTNKKMNVPMKTEQNFQVADSTPTTSPVPSKSVVSCKVCGDKASGYHYGVTSCEGCKGFFRRSIQKQIEYRCLRDGKCLVIRNNRNRCQFCRFRKCLSVGMSRDSVRYGRVPRRNRERESVSETRTVPEIPEETQPAVENRSMVSYDIIMAVSQAHHNFCLYTEERAKSLLRKPIVLCPPMDTSDPQTATSTADALDQDKLALWNNFASLITPSIQKIVEFAKRVPGFADLSQDDQLVLIKGGFFELWLTRASRLISTSDNTITFYEGSFLSQNQTEQLFDDDFSRSLFNFASTLNNLCLNDAEIGLFAAVILLTGDRVGIQDSKLVEQLQDKVIEALKVQMTRNHPGEAHLFTSLAMKLPELKQIGQRSNDHLDWLRINCNKINVPPLFSEIFDLPKFDERML